MEHGHTHATMKKRFTHVIDIPTRISEKGVKYAHMPMRQTGKAVLIHTNYKTKAEKPRHGINVRKNVPKT